VPIDVTSSRAQVRPIAKLKNQSEFTQTAYVGGENGGGLVEGIDERDELGSART